MSIECVIKSVHPNSTGSRAKISEYSEINSLSEHNWLFVKPDAFIFSKLNNSDSHSRSFCTETCLLCSFKDSVITELTKVVEP